MKLFLSALCASFLIAPLSFAADCGKCKKKDGDCDKEKQEETTLVADSGKCKKKDGGCDKEKQEEEGALA